VLLALDVPQAQALALDDDAGVHASGLELLVLDELVPDMGAVGLDDRAGSFWRSAS
jgi:hypothetical protein